MAGPTWTPPPAEEPSDEDVESRLLAPFLFGQPDQVKEHGDDGLDEHVRRLRAWLTMMTETPWGVGTASPPTSLDATVFLPQTLPGSSRPDRGLSAYRVMALFQAHLCRIPILQNRAWIAEMHDDWVLKVCAHLLIGQHIVAGWERNLPGILPDLQSVRADGSLTELWVGRKRVPYAGLPDAFDALLCGFLTTRSGPTCWVDGLVDAVRRVTPEHAALVLPGTAQRLREGLRRERLGAPPIPFWLGALHPSWRLEDPQADQVRANEWRQGPRPLRRLMSKLKAQPVRGEDAPSGHFLNAPATMAPDDGKRYPEWDVHLGRYRPSFAHIIEQDAPTGPMDAVQRIRDRYSAELSALRREFEQLKTEQRWIHCQREGTDLDMVRAVEAAIDAQAGIQPSEGIYRRFQKERRTLCVMVLVDLSGSTLGPVLAEAQRAIVFLSEAIQALSVPHSFYGFSSEGAQVCRFQRIRDWVDDETEVAKRMGSLVAGGGTRMGAHIRHATHLLQKRPEEHRLLLVVSDGRPEDRDGYRGRYGTADTAMAVRECASSGVQCHCVSMERKESEYLPILFGPHGFTKVGKPSDLAARLPQVFRSISWG